MSAYSHSNLENTSYEYEKICIQHHLSYLTGNYMEEKKYPQETEWIYNTNKIIKIFQKERKREKDSEEQITIVNIPIYTF